MKKCLPLLLLACLLSACATTEKTNSVSTYESMHKQIGNAMQDKRSEIRFCYEKAIRANPNIEGRTVAKWVIEPTGLVSNAHIESSTTGDVELDHCILAVINKIQFSKQSAPTPVTYPFVFQKH